VTLRRGCLIGAGSVVTKSVEAFAEVHGNPARHVGYIDVNGKKVLGQDRDSAT
jgi:acetyltransferase-like isoleucine patch superfamily enzyme